MTFVAAGVVVVLLLPGALFLASDLSTRLPRRIGGHPPEPRPRVLHLDRDSRPRLLFLVPAHNEESVIASCVESLDRMTYPDEEFGVIVVADNCTDRTAEIVRELGTECLERWNPEERGKPRAIAWALDRLDLKAWDYLVIVDADTEVDHKFGTALARAAIEGRGTHLQAYYGLDNTDESWLTRLSGLLVQVRYEALYPRKERSGLNCPLTGNGMGFRMSLMREKGWTYFSLTENWEAYARLTADGERIRYVRDARLFSQETASAGASVTRRQRWLAGRYGVLVRWIGPLVASRRIGFAQKLDALSELTYPGPVLHADLVVAASLLGFFVLPGSWFLTAVGVGALTLTPIIVPALRIASREGQLRDFVKPVALLPFFAVWRAGVAILTAMKSIGGMEWEKTERAESADGPEQDA